MEAISYNRPDWVDESSYPFRDNWMLIKGHQVHYLDEGPRDKPVLLFVHPGPGWSYTYRYQIEQLRKDFRCVAPDLPGYGLSKAANGYNFTLVEQAKILEEFVETLDLRSIILWANDGGGPTGILALGPHADRVVGLVVGGTFGWSIKEYKSVTRVLRLVSGPFFRLVNRYTNAVAWSVGRLGLGTRSMSKLEREHYTPPLKERNNRNRTLKLFRSFLDPATQASLDDSLPAFRDKSVLVLFGDKDPMTAQGWPDRWAREIPRHRVRLLPGVKHFTFEDDPVATVEEFLDWWSQERLLSSRNGQVRDVDADLTHSVQRD